MPLGRGQVLDGLGHAMHSPSAHFAPEKTLRKLVVRLGLGLRDDTAAVLQRPRALNLGFERIDVVEIGVHHLDADTCLDWIARDNAIASHRHNVDGFKHLWQAISPRPSARAALEIAYQGSPASQPIWQRHGAAGRIRVAVDRAPTSNKKTME